MADALLPKNQFKTEDDALVEEKLSSKDPFKQFQHWLNLACSTPSVKEPNAMALATVKKNGRPAIRMVLLKGFDENGFRFYTNYRSNKAEELEHNPCAALAFYWVELGHAVRIEGNVEKLPIKVSEEYFNTRPRQSQLSAHVSEHQSAPVTDRSVLKQRRKIFEEKYDKKAVTKPDYWGGYLIKPDLFEFWQGHTSGICDRIVFTRKENSSGEFLKDGENGWVYQRLEP